MAAVTNGHCKTCRILSARLRSLELLTSILKHCINSFPLSFFSPLALAALVPACHEIDELINRHDLDLAEKETVLSKNALRLYGM
jgi:hypothetical protein